MTETYTGLGFITVMFLVALAILWFLLPFAIFGTKDLLKQLIKETKETNQLLKKLNGIQEKDILIQKYNKSEISEITPGG